MPPPLPTTVEEERALADFKVKLQARRRLPRVDLSDEERQLLLAGLYELSVTRGGPDADMLSLVMHPRAVHFEPPTASFPGMSAEQRDVYLLTLEGRDTGAVAHILGMEEDAVARALSEAEGIAREGRWRTD